MIRNDVITQIWPLLTVKYNLKKLEITQLLNILKTSSPLYELSAFSDEKIYISVKDSWNIKS